MQKRDDSLRSLGLTVIAVDKPLREDIRQLSRSQGVTMVDYIRAKVEEDKRANPQAVMTSVSNPQARIERKLDNLIESIQAMVPDADKPDSVIEFMTRMMVAFGSLKAFTDKEYRYAEAKRLIDDSYETAEKAIKIIKENSAAKQAELKLQEN